MKRAALWTVLVVVLAGFFGLQPVGQARAADSIGSLTLEITGSPLSNLAASPLQVSQGFAITITDYVLRCQPGINTIELTLSAVTGGTITLGQRSGSSLSVEESLIENQALIIAAPDPSNPAGSAAQYWIRCLPHDFPELGVTEASVPPPGWYVTGNFGGTAYAMVLDNHGTPVWYRKSASIGALDVTPLPNQEVAWSGFGGAFFEAYSLQTHATRLLTRPLLDFHELAPLPNGNMMLFSDPQRTSVDMTSFGGSENATIVDCLVQEVGPNGDLVWQWRASDQISVLESTQATSQRRGDLFDPFHCNSIDSDPSSGTILLSARHTDAVYLIDKATGSIIWKLGGNSVAEAGAEILTVGGDPEGVFHAQHDARLQPGGDVSLYDDQTWDPNLAARGIEYHIDTVAGTATRVWAYRAPDGGNSAATGSFRRLYGGTDNVIGWGVKSNTLFTEVDAAGHIMLDVKFSAGRFAYRAIKVPPTALDHELLRAAAGLPPFSFTPAQPDPTISGTGTTLTTAEGSTLTGTIATVTDPDPNAIADQYLATIAWGDGSSSPGIVNGPPGGPFSVTGSHAYVDEGTEVATVFVSDVDAPANTAAVTSTVNVVDAALSATCATPSNSLISFNGTTARFTDADPNGTGSDYTATIDWGDGSSSAGTVSGPDGGHFTVRGTHAYAATGRFSVATTVGDAGGSTTASSCGVLVYAFPSAGLGTFAIGDSASANGTRATFWSAQWRMLNSLSGGLAPVGFKGFVQTQALPSCGVSWSAATGNTTPPPAGPLPAFMGVIVTSSAGPSGSTVVGNAVHLVVVQTNPGYQPDPGHPATGTVVAQVC